MTKITKRYAGERDTTSIVVATPDDLVRVNHGLHAQRDVALAALASAIILSDRLTPTELLTEAVTFLEGQGYREMATELGQQVAGQI